MLFYLSLPLSYRRSQRVSGRVIHCNLGLKSLRNRLGLYCCAEADGHVLDDGEWDTKDNNYRVFVQGEWTVVPDDAVLSGPNKFGKAIVWFKIHGAYLIPTYSAFFRDRGFEPVT